MQILPVRVRGPALILKTGPQCSGIWVPVSSSLETAALLGSHDAAVNPVRKRNWKPWRSSIFDIQWPHKSVSGLGNRTGDVDSGGHLAWRTCRVACYRLIWRWGWVPLGFAHMGSNPILITRWDGNSIDYIQSCESRFGPTPSSLCGSLLNRFSLGDHSPGFLWDCIIKPMCVATLTLIFTRSVGTLQPMNC